LDTFICKDNSLVKVAVVGINWRYPEKLGEIKEEILEKKMKLNDESKTDKQSLRTVGRSERGGRGR
jgi:hypothetical protein